MKHITERVLCKPLIIFLFVLSCARYGYAQTITSFAPATGAVGSNVVITGTGFNTTASNNIVFFGATKGTVTTATSTSLTVTVPAGASYQYISVTDISTHLTAYSTRPFIPAYGSFGNPTFATKTDLTTLVKPIALAVGDIDGDGKADIAIVNESGSTVSVLRNTSTSGVISFATKLDLASGSGTYSVAMGDVDGDGKPDLAITNLLSNTVSVLMNTSSAGSISFAAKVDFVTGNGPRAIAIGDVDGDGKPELVITNSYANTVSVLRNTSIAGMPSFAAKVDFTAGTNPSSIVIGDVNGDGKPDLAISNQQSNTLSVFRNTSTTGAPNFAAKVDFTTGANPMSITMGDIDGDGALDLAVANMGDGSNVSSVSVFRNTTVSGSISFNTKVDVATGSSFRAVAMGDINGDGKPDIAVTDANANTVTVIVNNSASGNISLVAGQGISTGASSFPIGLVIGDMDGDAKPDLISSNYSVSTISVLRNTSQTLQAAPTLTLTTFTPANGSIGSSVVITGTGFNTTAANNIVFFGATKATVTAATTTSLTVTVPTGASYQYISVTDLTTHLTAYSAKPFIETYPKTGTTAFATKVDFTANANCVNVSVGDIDGDGKPDIAVAYSAGSAISVFRNTSTAGTVSFAAKVDFATGTAPRSIAIGDIDGDGKPDLAVANATSNTISILLNTSVPGTVSFAAKVDLAASNGPQAIDMGDLDGDGKPDLAVRSVSTSSTVAVFRNQSSPGTVSFNSQIILATTASNSSNASIAIGDLDGDGKPDVAATNGASSSTVSIFRNTSLPGVLSFAAKSDITTGTMPSAVAIGDIDGDGKADLAVANLSVGTVSLLRNTSVSGTISFAAKTDVTIGSVVNHVGFSDLDGDGKIDLVTMNPNNFIPSFLLNTSVSGTISLATKIDLLPGLSAEGGGGLAIGDLDGDGKQDIVISNLGSNVSVLRNFIQLPAPTITNFTPASGAIGSNVTITGTNFNTTPSSNIVYFGATKATVTAATATSLTVTVPTGANYQNISVTNLSANLTAYTTKPFSVTYTTNNTLSFAARVNMATGSFPQSVTAGDIDGDGKPDLLTVNHNSNTVSMLRNNSVPGTINIAAKIDSVTGAYPVYVVMGDLDGDGKPDIATANYNSNTVSVFRNKSVSGTINVAAKADFATGGGPFSIAIGDIDGDGKPDIVSGNSTGNTVSVLRNTSVLSTISFAAKVDLATGFLPGIITIGDIDGDGKPDIVVVNSSSNTVSVFRNTSVSGTVSFAARVDLVTGTYPYAVAIGDIDGDGKADLAVVNQNSNTVSVFRNTSASGSISFAAKADLITGSSPHNISLTDVDGDGKIDLAVTNYLSNTVSVLRNTSTAGTISFAAKLDLATGNAPWAVSNGDMDGDGKPDLLVTNFNDNTVSVFRNTAAPTTFNTNPVSKTVNIGNSTSFFVKVLSLPPFTYQWQVNTGTGFSNITNGAPYSGATTDTLFITTPPLTFSTYQYRCVVTTNQISTNSTAAVLTMSPNPPTPVITTGGAPTLFCTGGNVTLTSSATTGNQWYINGAVISGAVNTTVTAAVSGAYTDTVTNIGGYKTGSAVTTVIAAPLPQVTLNSNGTVCLGAASFNLTAGNTSLSKIIWYKDSSVLTTVMTDTIGVTVAGGNGSGAAANQLNNPVGVFVDSSQNVYVSDYFNHRIQKWAPGATSGVTVAGGNGAGAAANQLYQPNGVYVDRSGNIYIADEANDRVQKWAPGATSGVTVAGGNGNGSAANQLNSADGVWVDSIGNIFIVDVGNHRIQKWAPGATTGVTVAGGNGNGSAANQLNNPQGVYADNNGNVYVADFSNRRIQKWTPGAATGITVAGGNGTGTAANQLGAAYGVFTDSAGNVYVADGSRIQKWTPGAASGVTLAGSSVAGSGAGRLRNASDVFLDRNGNIYISDDGNHRIQKWARKINTNYTPQTAGVYKTVVTDYNGCTAVSNNITVYAIPAVPIISADKAPTFCMGDSVALKSSSLTGNQWYKDGAAIPGATDTIYKATASGLYTDTVSNAGSCSAGSASITVTVNPLPTTPAISAGGSIVFCNGGSVVLTSSATTGNQWLKNGTVINGATNTTYTAATTGAYTTMVQNVNGCLIKSDSVTITVNALPAVPVINAGGATTFCDGGTVALSSSSNSGNQWYKNGTGIIGATDQTFTAATGGVYTVAVINASGCTATSVGINVTVNAIPAAPVINAGGVTAFCDGSNVVLTASGAPAGQTWVYQWSLNDSTIGGATSQTFTAIASGNYKVTVITPGGCSAISAGITLTANPLPAATISNGFEVSLAGAGLTLTANTGTGLGYKWFINDTLINGQSTNQLLVSRTGKYVVQVSDGAGCKTNSSPTNVTDIPTSGTTPVGGSIGGSKCVGCIISPIKVKTDGGTGNTPTGGGSISFCNGGSVNMSVSLSAGQTFVRWKDDANNTVGSLIKFTATTTGNYSAEVNTGAAIASTKPIVVTVNPLPSASIINAGANTICSGQSIILTATGGTVYNWRAGNNQIPGATGATYTVTLGNSYSVKAIDNNGCSALSGAIAVTVTPIPQSPVISAGSVTTFCSGNNVILTSSLATGNQWYKDGLLINGAANQTYAATATGKYTAGNTNNGGCTAFSNAVNVIVNETPATPVITAGGATTFCQGNNVVLNAPAASTGKAWTYQWSADNNVIGGASNQTLTAITSGTYSVTVMTDAGCTATSSAITVTANPSPVASITNTYRVGSNSTGSVALTANTGAGLAYQWYYNNALISSETSSTLNVSQTGNYTVVITNSNGCSTTSVAATVSGIPAQSAGGTTTFCKGGNVNISVSLANGESVVRWKDNSGNTVNGASTTYMATATGAYSAEIFDGTATTTTQPVTVVVNDLPNAMISAANNTTAICSGQALTLTATGGNNFQWYVDNVPIAAANASTYNATIQGSYSVKVTDNNNCTAMAAATPVNIISLPTVPVISNNGGVTTFCNGDSVILVSSSAVTNQWYLNSSIIPGATDQTYKATAAGIYTVGVTNTNGCSTASAGVPVTVNALPVIPVIGVSGATTICSGDSVTLNSSSTTTNQWYKDNAAIANAVNQSYSVQASGVYSVIVTNAIGCMAASAGTGVTVNPLPVAPTINAGSATIFCNGGSVALNASTTTGDQWYKDNIAIPGAVNQLYTATTGGAYKVAFTDNNGCTAVSAGTPVKVNDLPTVDSITGSATICKGSTTRYANTTTGGVWSSSNNAVATITSSGVATALSSGTAVITYAVTNASGCVTSVTKSLVINDIPQVAPITGVNSACEGATITLANTVSGGVWSSSNSTLAPVNNLGVVSGAAAGTITISYTITNAAGCKAVATNVITINPLPTLTLQPLAGSVSRGNSIQLTAIGTAGTLIAWTPASSLDNATGFTPVARPLDNTTYTATVTTAAGCSVSKSLVIQSIEDFVSITPPVLFTPNGDGINDRFVITNIDAYPVNTLHVFDKSGKLIFQAVNYHNEWDGLLSSKALTNDTYYYVLRVKDRIVKKGAITVLVK